MADVIAAEGRMDARELAALNGQLAIRLREGASRMASVMRGAAGMGRARDRKFADSPLERRGFEPSVPLQGCAGKRRSPPPV